MQSEIREAIQDVLSDIGAADANFVVEHPNDLSHGDYASNVALSVSKQLGKAPREIAEQLLAALSGKIKNVERIDIAGPGFLNFRLSRDFFFEKITTAGSAKKEWGKSDSWKDKKVIVEYTDPNPFKEFHIGHLFTNAVGESVARLFMMNGADTKRVNYQGDVGMHVAHAVYGVQKLDFDIDAITPKELGKAYAHGATAYKEDELAKDEIKIINKAIYERTDEKVNKIYDQGRKISLAYFEDIYSVVDTQFDEYFFESEAGPIGKELVSKHPDVFEDSDGAKVFKGEEYGLHTRVFVNGEGLPTYEAKELALAEMKEERLGVYDHSVISTANEITEYFKVLIKAMSFVYPELSVKTEHIGHGTVRLSSGKMSSRTGDVIPALTFIDEISEAVEQKMKESSGGTDAATARDVAIAAIKYTILKGTIFQDTVFDKEKALSFEGDSGPYLQYTHARIHSVLEKAELAGVSDEINVTPEQPYEIEKLLYRFPEIIETALAERAPHHVTQFLTEIASTFNSFYATEKIADITDEYAPYKVLIAQAVAVTLKNGLWTLGIKAPEKM